jgi:hypothetical protein
VEAPVEPQVAEKTMNLKPMTNVVQAMYLTSLLNITNRT